MLNNSRKIFSNFYRWDLSKIEQPKLYEEAKMLEGLLFFWWTQTLRTKANLVLSHSSNKINNKAKLNLRLTQDNSQLMSNPLKSSLHIRDNLSRKGSKPKTKLLRWIQRSQRKKSRSKWPSLQVRSKSHHSILRTNHCLLIRDSGQIISQLDSGTLATLAISILSFSSTTLCLNLLDKFFTTRMMGINRVI